MRIAKRNKPRQKFQSLRPFDTLRAVSTVEWLETEWGISPAGIILKFEFNPATGQWSIISNGVKA